MSKQATKTVMEMLRRSRIRPAMLAAMFMMTFALSTSALAQDILHNSQETGSTRWAPNGWGVAGGKYGKFSCETCHEPDSNQIKNVRSVINSMNGDLLPNGATSVSVSFQNVTSMGDDSTLRSSSNRICEVCHSKVEFHNYDNNNNALNGGGLGHPTQSAVCTSCHSHNTGFKASCGGCHGNPPTTTTPGTTGPILKPRLSYATDMTTAGAHEKHTADPPSGRKMPCDTCHYINNGGTKMPNLSNTIQIGFFGFGGTVTSGTYTPYSSTTTGYKFAAGTQNTTIAPVVTSYASANTCSNVYCHGGGIITGGTQVKVPLTGGLNTSPSWTASGSMNCNSCHGGDAAHAPSLGSHTKHASSVAAGGYGAYITCFACHPVASDNSHVQGYVRWNIDTADQRIGATATYRGAQNGVTGDPAPSSDYGVCANLYCHSNGRGGPGSANVVTPKWGDTTGFAGCTGCHGGAAGTSVPMASNGHKAHINNGDLKIACNECHNTVVDATNTGIIALNLHVDMNKEVAWGANASKGNGVQPYATNGCASVYCHSDGKGTFVAPVAWGTIADGSQGAMGCKGCHGKDTAFNHFSSLAGEPNYANEGAGLPRANSHQNHSKDGIISCVSCHSDTVTSAGAIVGSGKHGDGAINISLTGYNSGNKTCSNISCHGVASPALQWGGVGSCIACHGNLTTLPGVHSVHINDLITSGVASFYNYTANKSYGSYYRFGCANCHPADERLHRNGTVEVTISSIKQDRLGNLNVSRLGQLNTLATADGINASNSGITGTTRVSVSCELSYCHSNGKSTNLAVADYKASPNWYTTAPTANKCGMCHDNPPQYAGQSHYVATSSLGDNGTPPYRESGHMVGIHFMNVYAGNDQNGFLGYSSSGDKAHGNRAVASTISCNICHSGIVSDARVDTYAMAGTSSQFRCDSCHTPGSRTPLQSGEIADTGRHINGVKDIAFPSDPANRFFKTKAQLANVANALGWTRNGSYKTAGSYDSADLGVSTYSRDVNGTVTCVTACHVNQPNITWGAQLKCVSCHANQ